MYNSLEKDIDVLLSQYYPPVYAPSLPYKEVACKVAEMYAEAPHSAKSNGRIIKYLLSSLAVGVTPEDFFADRIDASGHFVGNLRNKAVKEQKESYSHILSPFEKDVSDYLYDGNFDFSHTSPNWENVLKLGLPGLKKRAESKQGDFYEGIVLAYEGAEIYFLRLREEALKQTRCKERMRLLADALLSLTKAPPKSTYEALLLIYLFFIMQSNIENTYVRAFGNLDTLLYPYYMKDVESGTFTKEQLRTLIRYFIVKLESLRVGPNQPFSLCLNDGSVNELSYVILEEFIIQRPAYTKIHIRYGKNTPADFMKMIARSIRKNGNSFVFINNDAVVNAFEKLGFDRTDAKNYGIVGCYEPYIQGKELPCTCNGRINTLKIFEKALASSCAQSFEDFLIEFKTALKNACDNVITIVSTLEGVYELHKFSPFLSSTYDCCMENGIDAYKGGAIYNSSSINVLGTASAADSLYALKTLVFDEKRVTLNELKQILENDWENSESLRLYAKSIKKYGNNYPEVDSLAREISSFCLDNINGRKNNRGGVFRGGTFSIDWRMEFGKRTGATPDGRKSGEPLSKNICACTACDKNGATAHMLSASSLDYTKTPNGTVLDLCLAPATVSGEDGINSLIALTKTFFKKGGFAVQYNVLDTETLKKSPAHT